MKVLIEFGKLAGERDIPKEAIEKDKFGRSRFLSQVGEAYYQTAATTESGLPIFRWDPPSRTAVGE